MKKCINCGAESEGKFCGFCGQETDFRRLEVKTIFHDVTHGLLHWENSILKTFRAMLLRPGISAREYINGSRKKYVKPFSYFIFIQTVFVVLFHRMNDKYFAFTNFSINYEESMHDKVEQIQHVLNAYINYLNYLMPVFLAAYFMLFFRKKTGVNYAESIALSFFWVGTMLVLGIVLMLVSLIDVRIWEARILVNVIYLVFAIFQFTGMTKLKGTLMSLTVIFLTYVTYSLFVLGILYYFISFLK